MDFMVTRVIRVVVINVRDYKYYGLLFKGYRILILRVSNNIL
jgi:hypothetical protein